MTKVCFLLTIWTQCCYSQCTEHWEPVTQGQSLLCKLNWQDVFLIRAQPKSSKTVYCNTASEFLNVLMILLGSISGNSFPPCCWPFWPWWPFGSESALCFLTDGLAYWSFPRLCGWHQLYVQTGLMHDTHNALDIHTVFSCK